MLLKMHGVRGSIPTPSADKSFFGGNTSCIEISTDDTQIFYDAGTGFAHAEFNQKASHHLMLFSHFHHDHIQGFGFNPSIYNPANHYAVSSALVPPQRLKTILSEYYHMPYFPIDVWGASSNLSIGEFHQTVQPLADDVLITSIELNHPGGACGYKFEHRSAKIAILLDNEFNPSQQQLLAQFCEGADIVVWDGTYTEDELRDKKGWGHSSIEQAASFCELADINQMVITHHAPHRTDDEMARLQKRYDGSALTFARDGMAFSLSSGQR